MRGVGLGLLLAGGLLPAFAYALPAIPSGSEINVTGSATFNSSDIIFSNPASIPVGGTTGAFTELGTSCNGCATMTTPFPYSPFTVSQLYTVSNNGNTGAFTAQANTLTQTIGTTDLIIHDKGTFTLSGFAPTKGTMDLTVNQGVLTGSFSSTGNSSGGGGGGVPEPATITLLAAGLVGLGAARAFRSAS